LLVRRKQKKIINLSVYIHSHYVNLVVQEEKKKSIEWKICWSGKDEWKSKTSVSSAILRITDAKNIYIIIKSVYAWRAIK